MEQRQKAFEIFLAGVESVKPKTLMQHTISVENGLLRIGKISINLACITNVYVVGFGKASAAMAQALESILGEQIAGGCVITKYEHAIPLQFIDLIEAGHPVPDENGLRGTKQILSVVDKASDGDLVICLISGGGSALLTDVPEGCTLDDLKALNGLLLKTGADISEINCIRKHLSKVKGGFLSKAAYPARVISLIISDVIGDPLDVIASGPTFPDPTTFADAISILRKYEIEDKVPEQIKRRLFHGLKNKVGETPKSTDEVLLRTENLIIGTNILALAVAKDRAESFGYDTRVITHTLSGNVSDVASYIMESVKVAAPNTCLLFAGEPTVHVTGTGLGGRNQHLALIIAEWLKEMPGVTLLVAGTDGTDGPTNAAGAVVDSTTWSNAVKLNLSVRKYIQNNDAYHFFRQEGGLVITGPTQTNVMDLMVALIQ